MGAIGSWSSVVPSGDSQLRLGDDTLRSHWSTLEATLEEEHYFTDASGISTGQHKPGSMRPHVGTVSQVSTANDSGRLMFDSDTSRLWYVGSEDTFPLSAGNGRVVEGYPSVRTDSQWSVLANADEMVHVIQTGRPFLGTASETSIQISFGLSYATQPRIVISYETALAAPRMLQLVIDPDTRDESGFTVMSFDSAGALYASNVRVPWMAIGPIQASLLS